MAQLIISIAILTGLLLLLAMIVAPRVRAGTMSHTTIAAAIAAIIAAGPLLFGLTGVLKIEWPALLIGTVILFVIAFAGGRAMAKSILGSASEK